MLITRRQRPLAEWWRDGKLITGSESRAQLLRQLESTRDHTRCHVELIQAAALAICIPYPVGFHLRPQDTKPMVLQGEIRLDLVAQYCGVLCRQHCCVRINRRG